MASRPDGVFVGVGCRAEAFPAKTILAAWSSTARRARVALTIVSLGIHVRAEGACETPMTTRGKLTAVFSRPDTGGRTTHLNVI